MLCLRKGRNDPEDLDGVLSVRDSRGLRHIADCNYGIFHILGFSEQIMRNLRKMHHGHAVRE